MNQEDDPATRKAIKATLRSAKKRAYKLGIPFDLTYEWVVKSLYRQDWRCRYTAVPFSLGDASYCPWKMSLDRQVPVKGYTRRNTQLVSMCYNQAKHIWDDDLVLTLAEAVVDNSVA